ncbi:MAG: DUF2085 domain-containing protein [Actinobacteria bacterium]|nr:DUF2085 domain-containing protein [Actinomycetota bacterium]
MSWWDRMLWELGFAICHQEPDKLLRFGDRQLFVCSRDTGIFVAFFTVLLVLSLARGRERAGMPPAWILSAAAAGVLFLLWDGLTSYLAFRETTNLLRFLSGFAAGGGMAFPAAALVNRVVFGGDRSLRVGSGPGDLIRAGCAAGAAAVPYLWRPAALFLPAQLWLAACLLGTIWALNLLLVHLLRGREGVGMVPTYVLAAAAMTALEFAVSHSLHHLLQPGLRA